MLDTQRSHRIAVELIDAAAIVADLEDTRRDPCRARARIAHRGGAAPQIGADAGARPRRGFTAQGPPRPALRRTAVPDAGRDHPHPVRIRRLRALSDAGAVRSRTHGGGGDRRLRPRPAGAGLRHRSVVSVAVQADRLGRAGRRGAALLPVGHGAEGRPRHAFGRRMHPPGQSRHDRPHGAARVALPVRRRQALTTSSPRGSTRKSRRAPRRNSSPPSSPSARSATAAPVSRAIWSSPTSRTARAACATCIRCSGSPNTSIACASRRN